MVALEARPEHGCDVDHFRGGYALPKWGIPRFQTLAVAEIINTPLGLTRRKDHRSQEALCLLPTQFLSVVTPHDVLHCISERDHLDGRQGQEAVETSGELGSYLIAAKALNAVHVARAPDRLDPHQCAVGRAAAPAAPEIGPCEDRSGPSPGDAASEDAVPNQIGARQGESPDGEQKSVCVLGVVEVVGAGRIQRADPSDLIASPRQDIDSASERRW
jgi:hypothetical protein